MTGPSGVEAHPASTIVLVRDGRVGLEVLLLLRNAAAGFAPETYVFPGGRVDAADAHESALSRVRGLSPEAAATRLDLPAGDPPAVAYYVAAVREAFEETGMLVGEADAPTDTDDEASPGKTRDAPSVRSALLDDEIDFAEALTRLNREVDLAGVRYIAHWITPVDRPKRFDTRFFLAAVAPGGAVSVDPREMSSAVWLPPKAALDGAAKGVLPMITPTVRTLEMLEGHASAGDALIALAHVSVEAILPAPGAREAGRRRT